MTDRAKVYPSSAITTWSGFLYQGQVALLHTLKLLTKNIDYQYALQLDSLEDFSIVTDNEEKKPVSLHQVKALKNTNYSTYKNAFEKLDTKCTLCDKLYFHIARELDEYVIKKISTDYPNMVLYNYGNDVHCCGLDDIKSKIIISAKELYKKHCPSEQFKNNDSYIEKSIHVWTDLITKKIFEIHTKVHAGLGSDDMLAYIDTISFNDFRTVVYKNLNDIEDDGEYYRHLAIYDFQRYYESYVFENADEIIEEVGIKLDNYMSEILVMSKENLERFIKGMIPERTFRFESITDYKDNGLNKSDMNNVFFETLRCIHAGEVTKSHIQWQCKEGNCYSPTAIGDIKKRKGDVCTNIIKNSIKSDVTLLFEGNTLITREINSESIYDDANHQTAIQRLEENHIMRAKHIKLIDMETAEGILNEKQD